MAVTAEMRALCEAMDMPVLIASADGRILHTSRRARALLKDGGGAPVAIGSLAFLRSCLATSNRRMGWLDLDAEEGTRRIACRGSRIATPDEPLVLLILEQPQSSQFAALTRQVEALRSEVAERQRTARRLAETVRERDLLLRELQHRVKNNMHMLAALLTLAEREAEQVEARTALAEASRRVSAVSAVQQLLYQEAGGSGLAAEPLAEALAELARTLGPEGTRITLDVPPLVFRTDSGVPVALILNELITNAVKYGAMDGSAPIIRIAVKREGDSVMVTVADEGPGFELAQGRKRGSGLGLVRGLTRQLAGRFTVEHEGGAVCRLVLPDSVVAGDLHGWAEVPA